VRVYYAAGYHVDMPVYRRVTSNDGWGNITYNQELASKDLERSGALFVTEWFEAENNRQCVDSLNGRQLRRTVRQIKKFARGRDSWKDQILSGFGITKLVTECYRGNADREDTALYDTMKAIRDRLQFNLIIAHPVTPNETITNGTDDARTRSLRDKFVEAIDNMAPLFEYDCTRAKALKCWDKVFATTFFNGRGESIAKSASTLLRAPSAGVAPAAPYTFPNDPRIDDKPSGFGSCGG